MKKSTVLYGILLVALASGGAWWWAQRSATPQVQYRTGKIERGNLKATVSASGAVNPVTQVSVGTQVSGQIKDLLVDFNSEVKAGQLIAVIDPETFEYRVRSAQADLDAAVAAVLTAQANASASRAAVSRAAVESQEAQRDLDRKQSLVEKQFIAQSEADKARALVNTAGETFKQMQAQSAVTDAQIKSAQANVAQREAALAQARVDLARTRITSPVSGIVIKRTIEKGQTVAASLQAPELFVIARNLRDMQVDASIDESDVGRIKSGQKATFTVDAFPGQTFEGEVRQVRKAAQTVASVVTYVAVVGFSNIGDRLLPGMTANVRVITDTRENVLKVPNAALRVRLAGVEPARPAAPGASGPASAPAAPASRTSVSWLGHWGGLGHAMAQAGGGMAAQREKLVTELKLSAEQQQKLDAISADLRPRFMALRELPEAQRAAERENIMSGMRASISAMLTPGQRSAYQQMLAQSSPTATTPSGAAAAGAKSANAQAPASAQSATQAAAPGPAPEAPAGAGPGGPGGNPMSEFRNRLTSELGLTPAQTEKVNAIYQDARPRFAALRDLSAEERPKARDRITADIRARIGDLLTGEQKTKYAALVAQSAGRQASSGRIYLLGADGKPLAVNVRLGITDGSSTELLLGPNAAQASLLVEGAVVITGTIATATGGASGAGPSGPRMSF
jgi:HlyD family secretion protein